MGLPWIGSREWWEAHLLASLGATMLTLSQIGYGLASLPIRKRNFKRTRELADERVCADIRCGQAFYSIKGWCCVFISTKQRGEPCLCMAIICCELRTCFGLSCSLVRIFCKCEKWSWTLTWVMIDSVSSFSFGFDTDDCIVIAIKNTQSFVNFTFNEDVHVFSDNRLHVPPWCISLSPLP